MTVDAVTLTKVAKTFGTFTALREVSFAIPDNAFFTLLGPSGCGKTTLLRLIAGFEAPTSGLIQLYGEGIEHLPPDRRPVNTVFQNYALFPHMTVAENIAFGLRMKRWKGPEIDARVAEMIRMVKLDAFAARRPAQLSGGQQQRVALARAMAPRPRVLLLDEPLSALDLKLRQEMREELKTLQRETGITFIFVTHDQEEALTMSDSIAVMSAGEVQQIGTPTEIYEAPRNRFVADFIGETNLLAARLTGVDAGLHCVLENGDTLVASGDPDTAPGTTGVVSIRPERLRLHADAGGTLHGTLGRATYLGTDTSYAVHLASGATLRVRQQNEGAAAPAEGSAVSLSFAPGAARFLVS